MKIKITQAMVRAAVRRKAKGRVNRTITFGRIPDGMHPWIGLEENVKTAPSRKCYDRPSPFTDDGYISPEGWFFQCDPCGHRTWANLMGVSESMLDGWGWVKVWSYPRANGRKDDGCPLILWDALKDAKPTEAQKDTIREWCHARNMKIKDAVGALYFVLEEE